MIMSLLYNIYIYFVIHEKKQKTTKKPGAKKKLFANYVYIYLINTLLHYIMTLLNFNKKIMYVNNSD